MANEINDKKKTGIPTKKQFQDALDDIHGRKDGVVKKQVGIPGFPNMNIINKGYGFEESITNMFQGLKDDIAKEKKEEEKK